MTRCCFLVLFKGDPQVRHSGHGWNPGGAFCFHRAMWKRHPFRDRRKSIDSWFLADNDPPVIRICGHAEQYIVVRHGANTWNLMTTGLADDYLRDLELYPKTIGEITPPLQARFYCRRPPRPAP